LKYIELDVKVLDLTGVAFGSEVSELGKKKPHFKGPRV